MITAGEAVHKLGELWPEVLGGFVAYCVHTVSHRLYHRAWSGLGRARVLGRILGRRP